MRTGRRAESGGWTIPVLVAAIGGVYCTAFFVRPLDTWPQWVCDVVGQSGRSFVSSLRGGFYALGFEGVIVQRLAVTAFMLILLCLVPWLAMLLFGRGRPADIGVRLPNRIGWRVLIVGYLVALPLVIWMANGERFAGTYLPRLRRGAWGFLGSYTVIFLVEHLFFQGVLLAACRRGARWPAPAPVAADSPHMLGRLLQWIGFAQYTKGVSGWRRLIRWIGLPDGCLFALVVSGLLFGWVHMGKDFRELLLSFPGGLALGYIAYRTNTFLVPFALHAATAGTACILIVLTAGPS